MKAKPEDIPVAVVQTIAVEWTKASRGGADAALRNRVPDALTLPKESVLEGDGNLFFHLAYYDEKDRFISPATKYERLDLNNDFQYGCVTVRRARDTLKVLYRYDYWKGGGLPERGYTNPKGTFVPVKKELDLRMNEWARVQYNGRHVDHDNGKWWYKKWTYNIGLFSCFSPKVFRFFAIQCGKSRKRRREPIDNRKEENVTRETEEVDVAGVDAVSSGFGSDLAVAGEPERVPAGSAGVAPVDRFSQRQSVLLPGVPGGV